MRVLAGGGEALITTVYARGDCKLTRWERKGEGGGGGGGGGDKYDESSRRSAQLAQEEVIYEEESLNQGTEKEATVLWIILIANKSAS